MAFDDRLRRQQLANMKKDEIIVEGNIKHISTLNLDSEVLCCRFNDTGKLLAIGLTSGNITVYSVESKGFAYVLKSTSKSSNPVTSLRWKPENSEQLYGYVLKATYVNGESKTWHVTTSTCSNIYTIEDSQLLTSAYNASGSQFVIGGSDGRIFVYDEEVGKQIAVMRSSVNAEIMDGHVMRVFALKYNPLDDNIFVSGGWDNTIQWWDTRASDQHSIKKISGPHICGEGIDIERNTQQLVAASWRKMKNLEVYDFGTGKLVKEIPAYNNTSMLYCTQWKDRNTIFVGGSHNHLMSVADYNSGLTIGSALNLPGGVCAMDYNRNAAHPRIAAASNKTVSIFSDDV